MTHIPEARMGYEREHRQPPRVRADWRAGAKIRNSRGAQGIHEETRQQVPQRKCVCGGTVERVIEGNFPSILWKETERERKATEEKSP